MCGSSCARQHKNAQEQMPLQQCSSMQGTCLDMGENMSVAAMLIISRFLSDTMQHGSVDGQVSTRPCS